jgi:hypothetical protein
MGWMDMDGWWKDVECWIEDGGGNGGRCERGNAD